MYISFKIKFLHRICACARKAIYVFAHNITECNNLKCERCLRNFKQTCSILQPYECYKLQTKITSKEY